MDRKERSDRFTELEERYAGYEVYDQAGENIGKVDDLFVNESDQPEYIGVKMGFLGMKATLIPMDVCTVDEGRHVIEVSESKDRVKDAPSFDDDEEITPEYENTVRSYFGLEGLQTSTDRGSYAPYYPSVRTEEAHDAGEERTDTSVGERSDQQERPGAATAGYREKEARSDVLEEEASSRSGEAQTGAGTEDGEREKSQDYPGISIGDRKESQEHPTPTAATGPESPDLRPAEEPAATERTGALAGGDRDYVAEEAEPTARTGETTEENELRMQRTEEELRTGTREREAGAVRVHKRVRTDREKMEVPKRREEVHVDQVPVEGRATETDTREDEVRVPIIEEEIVVEKRPVVKEELRIRKDVAEDVETLQEDVRRQEVEVEDETERGAR